MAKLVTTDHAEARIRHRGISPEQIATCMRWGDRYHTHDYHGHKGADRGETAYFLSADTVERARLAGVNIPYCNIAVVVAPNDTIVTVIRCRRPSKHWRPA